ncbi:MAG TPA: GIY-YIG nuclease family protein [Rickettsiales bacterium]|nr:GIY-YIG nuclease family protein [Rickettsiales bacterium]
MLEPVIYILASGKNGTIYTGVTSNLIKRVFQHKSGIVDGFSKKYDCKILVYYEVFNSIEGAISREKQLKNWKREWKIALIEKENKEWQDLYFELI